MANIAQNFIWNPGFALQNGDSLKSITNLLFGVATGIIAHAGGGQANATPLTAAINSVDTIASDNDSVVLPPAIPGLLVRVNNNGAHSLQVFGQAVGANAGVGDTIAAQGSVTQQPTATGVAQLTGVFSVYQCFTLGQWKQGSVS